MYIVIRSVRGQGDGKEGRVVRFVGVVYMMDGGENKEYSVCPVNVSAKVRRIFQTCKKSVQTVHFFCVCHFVREVLHAYARAHSVIFGDGMISSVTPKLCYR